MGMERTSSAHQYLSKYKVTVGELEQLAAEIKADTADRSLLLSEIEVKTKHSTYTFDDMNDFRSHRGWERDFESFSLTFSEQIHDENIGTRRVKITGGEGLDNSIQAFGEDEGWTIGTANTIATRMKKFEVKHFRLFFKTESMQFLWVLVVFLLFTSATMYLVIEYFIDLTMAKYMLIIAAIAYFLIPLWIVSKIPKKSLLLEHRQESINWTTTALVTLAVLALAIGVVTLALQGYSL